MKKADVYLATAEEMYIKGKTLVEISSVLGISHRTLSRWKRLSNWEEKRKKYLMNPLSASDILADEMAKLIRQLPFVKDKAEYARIVDELSKLAKVRETYQKIGDLSTQALYVFEKFTSFIREREKDNKVIEKLQKHIHGFIKLTMEERK